jgi:hypothetical protein
VRRLVAFVCWAHDAGWSDTWVVLSYPFRTWRCRLFGHDWGPEESDYDENIGARLSSSRSCQRNGCEGWLETYHHAEPADWKGRVIG